MPHIDWTINAGNILLYLGGIVCAFWRLYLLLDKRVSVFEQILNAHTITLTDHATRMDKHEDRILVVVESLQRVIGRLETRSDQ